MLTLVGNSPSSGSTLLADLLDSTHHTACGPELGLFATKNFYSKQLSSSITPSINASTYCRTNGVNKTNLFAYGLDEVQFKGLVRNSSDKNQFIRLFVERYLVLRGKDEKGILFEKTPQNVNCIEEFLAFSQDYYFVSIVRHPESVIRSLIKRGFSEYVAASTWLLDVAHIYPYLNHPRVIILKYEDLLENPFGTIVSLIKEISGVTLQEEEVKKSYEKNKYREIFEGRISSWSQQTVGKIGTLKKVGSIQYPGIKSMTIKDDYAQYFGLENVSFKAVALSLGYYDDYDGLTLDSRCEPKFKDRMDLLKKWLAAVKRREAKLSQLRVFTEPVLC